MPKSNDNFEQKDSQPHNEKAFKKPTRVVRDVKQVRLTGEGTMVEVHLGEDPRDTAEARKLEEKLVATGNQPTALYRSMEGLTARDRDDVLRTVIESQQWKKANENEPIQERSHSQKSICDWMQERVHVGKTGAIIPPDNVSRLKNASDFDIPSDAPPPNQDGIELIDLAATTTEQAAASTMVVADANNHEEKIVPVGSCSKGCYYPATYLAAATFMAWGYLALIVFACRALPVTASMEEIGVFAFCMSVLVNTVLPGRSAVSSLHRIYAHVLAADKAKKRDQKANVARQIFTLVLGLGAAFLTSLPFVVLDLRLQESSEQFFDDQNNASSTFSRSLNLPNFTGNSWPETFYLMERQLAAYKNISDENADLAGICASAHTTAADTSWTARSAGTGNAFTLMLAGDAIPLVDNGFEFLTQLYLTEWKKNQFGYRSAKLLTTVVCAGLIYAIANFPAPWGSDLSSLMAYCQVIFIPAAIVMTLCTRLNDSFTPAAKKEHNEDDFFVTFICNIALALLLLAIAPLPSIAMDYFEGSIVLQHLLVLSVFILARFSINLGGPFARDLKAVANVLSKPNILLIKYLIPRLQITNKDKAAAWLALSELTSKLPHALIYAINYVTLYAGFENVDLTVPADLRLIFKAGIFVSSYAFNNGLILNLIEERITNKLFFLLTHKLITKGHILWGGLSKEQQTKMRGFAKDNKNHSFYYIPPKITDRKTKTGDARLLSCFSRLAMASSKTRPTQERPQKAWIICQSLVSLVGDGALTISNMTIISFLNRTALAIASSNNGNELSDLAEIINALLTFIITAVVKKRLLCFSCSNPYTRDNEQEASADNTDSGEIPVQVAQTEDVSPVYRASLDGFFAEEKGTDADAVWEEKNMTPEELAAQTDFAHQ